MSEEEKEIKKKKGFFGRLFSRSEEPEEVEAAEESSEEVPEADAEESAAEPVETPAEPAVEPEPIPEPEPEPEPVEELEPEPEPEPEPEEEPPSEEEPAEDEAPAAEDEEEPKPDKKGLFGRLRKGLGKTRGGFVSKVDRALFGKKVVDEETLEELEEALVTADIGVNTALKLVEEVAERVSRRELTDPEALRLHLRGRIAEILLEEEGHFELEGHKPHVVLVIGVNGVGKTTTIGKIAGQFTSRGHKVLLGAADTFRAAAIEQLSTWGERVGVKVVRHEHGSDPAAVVFDTLEAAKARGSDLVLIDTAGRLHTKVNLMEEMKKIRRVAGKAIEGAPHEIMLVLDATNGQNAIMQAKEFSDAVGVDSIALTKLDGTAKGGVIVGICDELEIPVKFIGIGEQLEDLRPFDAREFVEALF